MSRTLLLIISGAQRMSRPSIAATVSIQRMLLPILLGVLVFCSFLVFKIFIVPVAWAAVLVYVTWPLYQWTLRKLSGREDAAAGIVTIGLMLIVGVPIGLGILALEHQMVYWYHQFHPKYNRTIHLFD